jgi:hypothetical protein
MTSVRFSTCCFEPVRNVGSAFFAGLHWKTITRFLKIRQRMAEDCERRSPLSAGEVEVDESYFGARRVRGKLMS